jgi:hypothetical protein
MSGDTVRYVSRHAVEVLRDRSEAAGYMEDNVLRRALDDAVVSAMATGDTHSVVDNEGAEATLCHLTNHLDGMLIRGKIYALVKENGRDSDKRDAVVTVLTENPAKKMIERAKDKSEPFNPALAALKEVNLEVTTTADPTPPDPPIALVTERQPQVEDLIASKVKLELELERVQKELVAAREGWATTIKKLADLVAEKTDGKVVIGLVGNDLVVGERV